MRRRSFYPTNFTITIVLVLHLLYLTNGSFINDLNEEDSWAIASYAIERATALEASTCDPEDLCTIDLKNCSEGYDCVCKTKRNVCCCYPKHENILPKINDTKMVYGSFYTYPIDKRASEIKMYRRSCIRRGGACDHRPTDCCSSASCRCNLWGSNCRCQRAGLFQKWG